VDKLKIYEFFLYAHTVKLKIFADKNICDNKFCSKIKDFTETDLFRQPGRSFSVKSLIFERKYFYPQFFLFFYLGTDGTLVKLKH
jgi:hypothetical protein